MTLVIAVGLATGCVYALVALGYSLIYRTTGVVNFSQGSYVTIGGLGTWAFYSRAGFPYPLAIVAGVALTGVVCGLFWILVVIPLWRRRTPSYVVLLSTVVASALLATLTEQLLTNEPQTLPAWAPGFNVTLGGTRIEGQYVLIVGAVLVLLALVGILLRTTTFGRSLRACAASRDTARLLGISPEIVGGIAMVFTGLLTGFGGALITPAQFTSPELGLLYGVFGYVAAVIGGFGSLPGALFGGLAVGLVQTFTVRYISVNYETVIVFATLLVFLVIRPRGLFGVAEFDRT